MKYFLVGIKGTGMSALAQILDGLGYEVEGSDKPDHFFTEQSLVEKGIKIYNFNKDNIKDDMIIIQGNAFKDTHEEIVRAKELGLKIYSYQDMVGKLTKMFQTITIAGCHGKTTTSTMAYQVLNALKGANCLIGDGTGIANKENKYFILEACEYKRHFLSYTPYYAIITNIELDHVDYYKDIDDVIDAYTDYANNAEKMVIACGDDPYTHSLQISKPIFYYGLDDDNDIIAKNVEYTESGVIFDVFVEDNYYGHFDLPLYGKHMLLDALAVISLCYYERFDAKEISKILKEFHAAKRRFNETVVGSNILIDDYAHHPTELKCTIKSAKQKYPHKKIVAIWGPHTYSRTKAFKDEYIEILKTVDKAYIMDIYAAREQDNHEIDINDIIKAIPNAQHISKEEIDKLLDYEDVVLLFMSPNDLTSFEQEYINKYHEIHDKKDEPNEN